MLIEDDKKVRRKAGLQDEHLKKVKEDLAKNQAIDDKVAKERIKEKRIKVKKRLRAEMGQDDDDGEGGGVVLGTPSDG